MKHVMPLDVLAASRELPQLRPALIAHITTHVLRLKEINPSLGGLIELIGERAKSAHEEVATQTADEFRQYITALILLLVRTLEIAESRETIGSADELDALPLDPNILPQELLAKLFKPD
ncbi:MAG: hypothetical protein A2845_00680 [Candidatus Lloydbacteria bacterium RIFCSPHIGHO2_01_FULL_49_22]|uniref:Uncharacterized protein n=1 Tax=Candidatus Lloydbacteria bacterium RIFCSPHIGHO2_01_FULL_49_22 TaxID=1798658 RepID=A0A1G2CY40_9BACT|nr:MAG: hypothetical protein A2845_00680 [Candidatus Lloydbacteria bacterium RIFCSPHIGHO2_01_FULL_49_22]OGZ09374.1 MAG: hypothetical protein A3C14_05585 [Candidatus Lloydbacteria bacterium RIFCSPHIGHO2_02_FULL_50_18]